MAKEKEDFYDIFKRFAKKTETLIDKQVDKLKENGTIDQIEGYINKTGDYVGKKIEQFKNSDIPDKVDDFVEKTEANAEVAIKKAGDVGDKISEKIEDAFDNLKKRTNQKENSNPEKESKDQKQI